MRDRALSGLRRAPHWYTTGTYAETDRAAPEWRAYPLGRASTGRARARVRNAFRRPIRGSASVLARRRSSDLLRHTTLRHSAHGLLLSRPRCEGRRPAAEARMPSDLARRAHGCDARLQSYRRHRRPRCALPLAPAWPLPEDDPYRDGRGLARLAIGGQGEDLHPAPSILAEHGMVEAQCLVRCRCFTAATRRRRAADLVGGHFVRRTTRLDVSQRPPPMAWTSE